MSLRSEPEEDASLRSDTDRGPAVAEALEVTVTAPVVSFRDPLYSGVLVTLPCPSPATVGGMLAAAAGGWGKVDKDLSFAMSFHARGAGTDLETYHPEVPVGPAASPTPRSREFLAAVTLRVWLWDEPELWRARLRRPRWPLRLGRSQDLVGVRTRMVQLYEEPGRLGSAVVVHSSESEAAAGRELRMQCAVAPDRGAVRWGSFRFDRLGLSQHVVPGTWSTADGEAVAALPSPHPDTVRGHGGEAGG